MAVSHGAAIAATHSAAKRLLVAFKLAAGPVVTAAMPQLVLVVLGAMPASGDRAMGSGESFASAASQIDTTAFNQNIVMGANVLGNSVDMTVVGGGFSSSYIGDDGDGA